MCSADRLLLLSAIWAHDAKVALVKANPRGSSLRGSAGEMMKPERLRSQSRADFGRPEADRRRCARCR